MEEVLKGELEMTSEARRRVVEEILDERKRQDKIWGGYEHDITHTKDEWLSFILVYLGKAAHWEISREEYMMNLVKAGALIHAALETTYLDHYVGNPLEAVAEAPDEQE